MSTDYTISLGHNEKCEFCRRLIPSSSLMLTERRGRVYPPEHLDCYRTFAEIAFIIGDNVTLTELSGVYEERAWEWAAKWNSRFVSNESGVPRIYKTKSVDSRPSSRRRLWLIVCQFLDSQSVLQTIAVVCHEMYHITWEEELWYFKFAIDFPTASETPTESYRALYISYIMKRCWECRTILSLHDFCDHHSIDRNLLSYLNFSTFRYSTVAEFFDDLLRIIVPYVEKRRSILIDWLEKGSSAVECSDILKNIKSIDLLPFYKSRLSWRVPKALAHFLGRSELNEDWEESIRELLEHITFDNLHD